MYRFLGIVSLSEEPAVLRCAGDEDLTTRWRRRAALSRALRVRSDLLVDLAGLTFADTSLMVDLAMVARRLRASGRCLRLSGAQPQVWRVVEAVGLHRQPGVVVVGSSPSPALA